MRLVAWRKLLLCSNERDYTARLIDAVGRKMEAHEEHEQEEEEEEEGEEEEEAEKGGPITCI